MSEVNPNETFLESLRYVFARVSNFSLDELPLGQKILSAAVSCGVFAFATIMGWAGL